MKRINWSLVGVWMVFFAGGALLVYGVIGLIVEAFR